MPFSTFVPIFIIVTFVPISTIITFVPIYTIVTFVPIYTIVTFVPFFKVQLFAIKGELKQSQSQLFRYSRPIKIISNFQSLLKSLFETGF